MKKVNNNVADYEKLFNKIASMKKYNMLFDAGFIIKKYKFPPTVYYSILNKTENTIQAFDNYIKQFENEK